MFIGFREEEIAGSGARLFVRHGGNLKGPPVVLLHGYPQTSAMWHRVAPILAETHRIVCPDLRGYGRSEKPKSDRLHLAHSKRSMAGDIVAVMERLGYRRFLVGGHDRGARVAHRLGLDFPRRAVGLCLLDIAPTRETYANISEEFAKSYWHWFFLIQDQPLPETLIGGAPDAYWKLKCMRQADGAIPFHPEALKEYLNAFRDPAAIHASCEDYRAAASIDITHDNEDGGRTLSMPVHLIWAANGTTANCFDPIELWNRRADQVEGQSVAASHYMAEEVPELIAERMLNFFADCWQRAGSHSETGGPEPLPVHG